MFHRFILKDIKPLPVHFAVPNSLLFCSTATPSIMTSPTIPIYQNDSQLTTFETEITSTLPLTSYPEADIALFKLATPPESSSDQHILTTTASIFHPQGGGQPSDTGIITSPTSATPPISFTVTSVRQSPSSQILHLGTYTTPDPFTPSAPCIQSIDASSRHLYSRLHTAGHVLGLAARHYLSSIGITDITDGKASHFPGMSSVEFIGLIDGKHKAGIQAQLDAYIAADMPVEIHEWDALTVEAKAKNGEIYMPENGMDTNGILRVVEIKGAGAYPCGGTHVQTTGECGRVSAYKISRQKGLSKVSYRLDD